MLTGSIFRGDGRATAAQHRPHTPTQANDCAARLLRFRDGPMTQNYNWTYISDDDGTSQKGFVTDASWCDAVENWEDGLRVVCLKSIWCPLLKVLVRIDSSHSSSFAIKGLLQLRNISLLHFQHCIKSSLALARIGIVLHLQQLLRNNLP